MHVGAFLLVNLIQSLLAALFLAFPDQPKRQGQSLSIRFDGEKDSLGVGQAGLVDGLGGKEGKKGLCFFAAGRVLPGAGNRGGTSV